MSVPVSWKSSPCLPWHIGTLVVCFWVLLPGGYGEEVVPASPGKILHVGMVRDFAPYQFEQDGRPAGYDVELVRAAAQAVGYSVVFETGTWNTIRRDVASGRLDAIAGMTIMPAGDSLFRMSVPTCEITHAIFTKPGNGISSSSDLKAKTVAISRESAMISFLQGRSMVTNLVYADDDANAMDRLRLGLVDAVILPKNQGKYYIDTLSLPDIHPLEEEVYSGAHGIVVLSENASLLMRLNEGLTLLESNGQFDQIFRRWFGPDAPRIPRKVIRFFLIGASVLVLLLISSLLLVHLLRKHIRMRSVELADSEAQYRLLTDNVPDMISRHAPNGRILYVSSMSFALLGYEPESLLGRYPQEYIHPDDLPLMVDSLSAIVNAPSISRNSCRAQHRNGHYIWVEVTNRSLAKMKGGPVTEILSVTRDVTERVLAEETLRREREFTRLVLENVADAVIACDEQGKIQFLNNTARRWHGVEWASIFPDQWAEYYHLYADDGVTLLAADRIPLRRAFLGEEIHEEALSIIVPGEAPRHVLASAAPMHDEQDRKLGAVVALHDVTRQRHAEKVLRESEEKFRLLFDAMIEGVALHELICDEVGLPVDYYILEVNPAFERHTGRSMPTKNKIRASLFYRMTPPPFLEAYATVALTGQSCSFEVFMDCLNRHMSISAFSFCPGQFATVFEDITERKETEARIQKLNVELEERVRERTAALEATNRELEAFVYSVSHDLRAPLRGIDGFSQALVEEWGTRLDDRSRHYLERVRLNAQRMGGLIDDLLRLSRITQADMIRERVDLTRLADKILVDFKVRDEDRRIDWVLEQHLVAWGDGRLLEIALGNLLSNAWKFTLNRSVGRIEFGRVMQDGMPVYYVRDNGAGFDMTYAGKLFGAFQRLHRQEEYEGTGVGLATVQRIIHRHGGTIWAEAAPEQGATFYFTLGEKAEEARRECV